jgi:SNF2 family DNA or RNA helicase
VADEAQQVKNTASAGARELRRLPARARIALTGTPVENHLLDLWAILDWTTPGLLGSRQAFRAWAASVERGEDEEAGTRLRQLVQPFMLRRRKSDPGVAPELPPKIETNHLVALTREQVGLYEAVVRETVAAIRGSDGIQRRGLVLKLITLLKQICNHPAQYLHEEGPIAGRSGKLEALDDLLEVILAEGESALVFTQYVDMGNLLARHLAGRCATAFLHGGLPARRRDDMVRRFQSGEVPVFLISLRAGGFGLNHSRASPVVHLDRWWNPAVEDQATDRAHRIGQDRTVQVHRLVTEGTVEDKIATLLSRKRDLADRVVGAGEAWVSELSDDELSQLVRLQRA